MKTKSNNYYKSKKKRKKLNYEKNNFINLKKIHIFFIFFSYFNK